MSRLETGFLAVNRWILILLLAGMSIIIFTNVCLRYLTDVSLPWAEEVGRYMMIWLTLLGAGPVLRSGGHIAVENFQDLLSPRLAAALRLFVSALLFMLFAILVWQGWIYMQRTLLQTTPVTQIPFAYIYGAFFVGGLNLIAHFLLIVRGYVLRREFAPDDHFDSTASASL